MFRANHPGETLRSHFSRLFDTEAAALIEFAVSLPLLVVLVVGIFDFGGAFNLKQELNNAAREGARVAANQPTNDLLGNPTPASVDAVRYVVAAYLQNAHINDCGLSTMTQPNGVAFVWTYLPAGCSLKLVINRGAAAFVPETVGGVPVNMQCTIVQITYPYQWHFNSVIQLLVPGANFALTNIQSNATAVNMN